MTAPRTARPAAGRVVSLGKFDGFHLGHQALARAMIELAEQLGASTEALVLWPDPRTVLQGLAVKVLMPVEARLQQLVDFGVDVAEAMPFTNELSAMTPGSFVADLARPRQTPDEARRRSSRVLRGPRQDPSGAHVHLGGRPPRGEVLWDEIGESWQGEGPLAGIVVGRGFRFGAGREGTVDTLRELGGAQGFHVVEVPPVVVDGEPVSSDRLRAMISRGEVEAARRSLGRPFRLSGIVVHGVARGRELGFPTANLELLADYVIPANGIYTVRAAWTSLDGAGRTADGLASVGVRPTFDNGARVVEVYLLDFEDDLYGADLAVDFLAYQRPELRFESVEDLVTQMHIDVEVARRVLGDETPRSRPATYN